jgi:hypothetical protein
MIYFYYYLLLPTRIFLEKEYARPTQRYLRTIREKGTYSESKNVSFILNTVKWHV